MTELIQIVVDETNEDAIMDSDEAHKTLLKKYVTVAKTLTNIEMFSFVFCFFLLYVLPYFISLATSSWINPLSIEIIGVR